ncbi:MAG TPA: ribosome-inactivating family protein [Gemmataceae bacterium]|jgi:hypothetical protein|nr:ribosome-inactivating family protein [Gemmataceae bacterium]
MAVSIATLPEVTLDYTRGGVGLHAGLTELERLLAAAGGRTGHVRVLVTVTGATVPVVMARTDLYVMGFRCGGQWFRFNDAAWPFTEAATPLGHDGQYGSLGGLTGALPPGGVTGVARLTDVGQRPNWKESLRTLLVIVSECTRLIPVRMQVLGLLNGILPTIELGPLARYIQNWDKASKGKDMSVEAGPNLRTGFNDPTIVKR